MIFLSSWFEQHGISAKNVFDHKKYGWIESIGRGAYVRQGVKPDILAAVSAVQTQTTYSMHLGGLYSLDQFHDIRQYIRNDLSPQIFTTETSSLPSWFKTTFEDSYKVKVASFLPEELGIEERDYNGLRIRVSCLERSLLEMLYNNEVSTNEAFQILELVPVLKPALMNNLLQNCKSIKVKRLFLYIASKTGYAWYNKLEIDKLDLGSGVREIDKDGSFNKDFNIIVAQIAEV